VPVWRKLTEWHTPVIKSKGEIRHFLKLSNISNGTISGRWIFYSKNSTEADELCNVNEMGATQRHRLMDGSLIWADSLQIRQQKIEETRQTIKVLTSRRTAQMINTTICGREETTAWAE
jgi:hypothetical protein